MKRKSIWSDYALDQFLKITGNIELYFDKEAARNFIIDITGQGKDYSAAVVIDITDLVDMFAENPEHGNIIEEYESEGIWHYTYEKDKLKYRIVYKVMPYEIHIVSIFQLTH